MQSTRALTALVVALLALPAVSAQGAARPKVAMQVFSDPGSGVAVAVPRGWEVSTANGTLTLTRGPEQRVGVMILPARVHVDMPAQAWLQRFGAAIAEAVQASGGQLRLGTARPRGEALVAPVEGVADGVAMRGVLEVTCEPGFVTMKLIFAPAADWAREEPVLSHVAQSFRRATATYVGGEQPSAARPLAAGTGGSGRVLAEAVVLQRHQGSHFRVALPRGWEVVGESFRGIDLKARDGSGHVNYAFMLHAAPGITPQAVIQQLLPMAVREVRVVREVPQESPGPGWQVMAAEITGVDVLLGRPVRGMVTVGVQDVMGYATHLQIAVRTAPEALWSARRALLATVQDGVVLTGGQAPPGYELIPARTNPCDSSSILSAGLYRDQVRSRASAAWSHAMLGTERVSSRTVGSLTVPQSSWWGTGPQGPGYYRALPGNSYEKLEVER